ncbi:hypothetical protein K438DRAFT_1936348 [Mycena galopus ATCC 62051]|nr:hypothetical protein K438DRAFT_1936348 [Mycena galopus ATCC 62051]
MATSAVTAGDLLRIERDVTPSSMARRLAATGFRYHGWNLQRAYYLRWTHIIPMLNAQRISTNSNVQKSQSGIVEVDWLLTVLPTDSPRQNTTASKEFPSAELGFVAGNRAITPLRSVFNPQGRWTTSGAAGKKPDLLPNSERSRTPVGDAQNVSPTASNHLNRKVSKVDSNRAQVYRSIPQRATPGSEIQQMRPARAV